MQEAFPWYRRIEPAVRDVVFALRNNGFNTTCSCGHKMTVQVETCNMTDEFATISQVLRDLGYSSFRIEGLWDEYLHGSSRFITITLSAPPDKQA